MTKILAITAMAFAVAACGKTPAPAQQIPSPASMLQCGNDVDRKGDRICDRGQCVNSPATTPLAPEKTIEALAAPAPPKVNDPVPVCVAADGPTVIPVWKPEMGVATAAGASASRVDHRADASWSAGLAAARG